jgi:hypothetical protein
MGAINKAKDPVLLAPTLTLPVGGGKNGLFPLRLNILADQEKP